MPVVMSLHWPEASLDTYEQARKEVGWEREPAAGGLFHICWMAPEGLRVIDVWDAPESFQRFQETRLGPVLQRIGVPGQPNVTFAPLHALFNASVPVTGANATVRKPAAKKARRPTKKAKAKGKKKAATPRRSKGKAKR